MSENEIEKRIAQLDGYAKALIAAIRQMDQGKYILLPLLDNEELKNELARKFQNTHGCYAYNQLVPIFSHDLIRDCARLFLDPGEKACSLINLHRKASDKDINKILRMKFRNIPDQFGDVRVYGRKLSPEDEQKYFANFREQQKEKYEDDFMSSWEKISAYVNELEKNEIAAKIKTFRDKYFAHLEMQPLNQEPIPYSVEKLGLKFCNVFGFMDESVRHCVDLVRLITGSNHVIGSFAEVHKKRGENMWALLAQ